MSWQEYVDSTLISTGTVSAAAIVGLDGNVWSASAGFTVTEKEALKLISMIKKKSSGKVKGGACTDKRKQRRYINKDEVSLPTKSGAIHNYRFARRKGFSNSVCDRYLPDGNIE